MHRLNEALVVGALAGIADEQARLHLRGFARHVLEEVLEPLTQCFERMSIETVVGMPERTIGGVLTRRPDHGHDPNGVPPGDQVVDGSAQRIAFGAIYSLERAGPPREVPPLELVSDAVSGLDVPKRPVDRLPSAHEVSRQLRADGVGNAVIDTDELDHIYPAPANLASLTEQSLRAVWSVLSTHGARRLILVGVHLDRDDELRWVSAAVPGAVFTRVQLTASPETLGERILRREIGTGAADQLERTMAQLASLGRPGDDVRALPTDGRSPRELGAAVIALWRPGERARA